MADVDINKLEIFLEKKFKASLKRVNKTTMPKVGDFLVEDITARTVRGSGVTVKGTIKKLKALAPATKKARKRKKGGLDGRTAPARSNQIETGQMIDSLTFKKIRNGIRLFWNNKFAQNKAMWNVQLGRRILGVDKKQKKKIIEMIEKELHRV